jgi:hypothetical protein
MPFMPLDISRITDTLYIAAHPTPADAEYLRELPTYLMLSIRMRPPHRHVRAAATEWLHLPCMDTPLTPLPMLLLWTGVERALPVINKGKNVVVHCAYGRHRSVALACCILIAEGHSAEDAMALVKRQRPVADPYIRYIRGRIERFEAKWTL